ncbi:MAG TPA: PEGA domain-containing protein [Methanoregulaceae archaeon]|nr:PEGA domain-containing protein [Methanoregulaceae archaeon]
MKYLCTLLVILCLLPVIAVPVGGATTAVRVVLYAADGYTILNETTVDYRWMEAHLPVMGDGTTQYYHQGPVFIDDPDEATEEALRWNPEEDSNVESKAMGAVKGTGVRDLCELVGGMQPDEEVKIVSADGWSMRFAYANVYEYSGREGPMILAWYNGAEAPGTWERQGTGYVPDYQSGMRLVWLADTSTNPQGLHAFGNYDWHEAAEPEYWYYYQSGGERYPTTTGLSGKYISEIHILSNREPEGSIEITSNPPGARISLDGIDSGFETPCTIEAVSEGLYSLVVRKEGYLVPEEQAVEVIPGKSLPVHFDLVPAPAGGGDSGTDSSGSGPLSPFPDLAILEGRQLAMTEFLRINGSFSAHPSTTLPFILKGGEEGAVAFDKNISDSSPELLRLYLFFDRSSADPGIDADPKVALVTDQGEVTPIRTWVERGEDDLPYATTLVFSPPALDPDGTVIVRSRNHVSWNSTVAGGLLLMGYEDPGAGINGVWIAEGADLIGEAPSLGSSMTLAEFTGPFPDREPNATLVLATTPSSAAGNLSFFINGVSMPGRLVSGESPVATHEILLQDGTGSMVRFHTGADDSVVTCRVAILSMDISDLAEDTAGSIPTMGTITPVTTPSGVASPRESIPPTRETTSLPASPGGAENASGSDPIGSVLCWLHNFVLWLQGMPAEPCYQHDVPGMPLNPTPPPTPDIPPAENFTILVVSSPAGAGVVLDGQPTGLITPCNLMVPFEGEHTVRLTKEGYQPVEQVIRGNEAIEILLHPFQPAAMTTTMPPGIPVPATGTSQAHYGGLYIRTYPEQAEIKIDGIIVGTRSPLLVSPLREGFHTISAGILTTGNAYASQETIRAWVFTDAIMPVEFNLMDAASSGSVTIGGEAWKGTSFTVNGYYPVKRVPEKVELAEHPSFVTLMNDTAFYSYTIPQSSRDSREFFVPAKTPLVCNLSVGSDPAGAEIFIDGIRTGLITPAVIPNVSEGYHRISLTAGNRIPVTERIFVAESQCLLGRYQVKYSLPWYASGSIILTSDPPGAAVSIRGLKTGEVTPCTIDGIPIGVWEVLLTLEKAKRYLDATVEPGKTRNYSVVFD